MIPRRTASVVLGGLALLAPVICLPLLLHPRLGLGAGVAVLFTLLLWASPGNALGLAHAGDLAPLLGGSTTSGISLELFVAVTAATVFAVVRRPERLPGRMVYYLPILLSFTLLIVMLARLPDSPAESYGSHKLKAFLLLNVSLLVGGLVVGTRRRDVNRSLALMLIVAFIAGLALAHEILTGVQPLFEGRYAISNAQYDPITLGRLSASGLLIALYVLLAPGSRFRLAAAVAAPLMTISLLASGGRGTLLGILAGLVVLFGVPSVFNVRRSTIAASIATSLVVALAIVPAQARQRATSVLLGGAEGRTSGGRSGLWTQALDTFLHHPLGGIGTGGFASFDPLASYPHNLFLETASELGFLGLVPLVGALAIGAWLIVKAIRGSAGAERGLLTLVAALLASAFMNALFSTDISANYDVWLFLGLGIGLASRSSRQTRRSAINEAVA
jgi:O-antigen ligase